MRLRSQRAPGTPAPVSCTGRATLVSALAFVLLTPVLVGCGGDDRMLEQMRAISRRTEEIQAAIEIDRPEERKRIAGRAYELLRAKWLVLASEEPAWRGILGEAIDAAQRLATTDSREDARAAHRELEASCWRCHERYVDGTVSWVPR